MPASKHQKYIVITKSSKFGEYSYLIKDGTNCNKVGQQARLEGHRVLITLSREGLIRLQNLPKTQWSKSIMRGWSDDSRNFVLTIPINML